MREDKTLALMLVSVVLACGGVGMQPSASETLTVWRTITSKTTYTSTSMSLRASYVVTTSIETSTHTRLEDSTQTFANYGADIRQERAAHYPVSAVVIEITLPPEIIPPGEDRAWVTMEYHYRSPKSMLLERIGLSTWMDMRTSSQPGFMYWPTKVNVSEGTGSLFDSEYIDRNYTKVSTVYISKEGILPEILSVDLKRVWEDAVTETSTALKTQIFRTIVTYTETIEKTYTKTMTYKTYETYVVTPSPITTATKETFTTPPTSTTTVRTLTPTATPSPIPSIDMLGFEILIFVIVAALVGFAVGLTIRRRRKPEAPYVPPPLPSPI